MAIQLPFLFVLNEIVREISEYRANLDFDKIIESEKENALDQHFLMIQWQVQDSQPDSSDGYRIVQKYPEQYIMDIADLQDVIDFINDEMNDYLEKKGN